MMYGKIVLSKKGMNTMRRTYPALSDEDKDYLKTLSKKRTIQAQIVDRAKILLYKSEGMTFSDIAEKLAVSSSTVRLCISKYYEGGVENALFDTRRPGRPSEITDDAKAWMLNIACQRPVELGYAQELWTLNSLHKHIQKHAEEAGEAIPLVSETHKSSDFIEFLKIPDKKYPLQDTIRIIPDNHSAHTSKETQRFLNTMPKGRFKFVFTPKHGSWLNMIESFFSKMTKQMLRGIRVNTKQELKERIYQYFEEVNCEPVVYHWKYKMDEISEAEASSI